MPKPPKREMMEVFTILEKVQEPTPSTRSRRNQPVEKYRTLVVDGQEWCFTGQVRIPYQTRLIQQKFEAGEATEYYFTFRNPEHPTRKLSTNDFVEWRGRLYKIAGFAFEFNNEFIILTVQRIKGSVDRVA